MPVNRSGVLGLNYQLPGEGADSNALIPQQQPVGNPSADIGGPEQGLQYVDGATSDYFKKWAMLKSFAHDAEQNLGINVQAPDYSRPESIQLNRIYNKALADLKYQGNLLKESQKMLTASNQREDIQVTDPSSSPFATQRQGTDYFANEADPLVTEANDVLNQPYYGSTINKANEFYKEKYDQLTQLAERQPERKDYWLRQRDILVKPRKAEREFNPYTYNRNVGENRKIKTAGNFAKKITNLVQGVTQGFKPSETDLTPQGSPYLVNSDYKGVKYGGHRIEYTRHDPKTNETSFVLDDGQVVPLTGEDPMSVARALLGENTGRFGTDAEYIDVWADENNLINADGSLNTQSLLTPDAEDIRKKNTEAVTSTGSKVTSQVEQLDKDLNGMKAYLIGSNDSKDFKLKDGQTMVVKRDSYGNDKYTIENLEELYPATSFKNAAEAKAFYDSMKSLSKDQVRQLLISEGAHLSYPAKETQEPVKPSSGTEVAPDNETPEQKRIRELKAKYGVGN